MASLTAYRSNPLNVLQGRQLNWPVFVCRQGIFLFDPSAYFPIDPEEVLVSYHGVTANPSLGYVMLPPCREKDELLSQPPLGISLTQDEAAELISDSLGAAGTIAATDIGPAAQEKNSNQDFALAASIKVARPDNTNAIYQFTAVADGVTTRTLWPERSARIAVLCAWRVAREHVKAQRGFTHEAFDKFRDELIRAIREALENDMAYLLGSQDELVPPGWARDTYRQFKPRKELWYNSTLLVALVGSEGGFVLTAGDGGLLVRKTERGETRSTILVHSTDDVSVSGVVSLGPDALKFRQARIAVTPETRIELIMSTDGVDRSLRRAASRNEPDFNPYGNEFFDLRNSADLRGRVEEILSQIPEREIDNVSTATLCWPPSPDRRLAPAPGFEGPIAGVGDTVDDINANAERIVRRGKAKIRDMELELHVRAIDRVRAIELSSRRQQTSGVNLRSSELSPPPESKWGHLQKRGPSAQNPSGTRDVASAGNVAARIALKYLDLDSKFKRSAVQEFVDSQLARLEASDRNDFEVPNFSKIIFYGLAYGYLEQGRIRTLTVRDVERQIDLAIWQECGRLPCIAFEDIDLYVSRQIMQFVTDSLRQAGFLPSEGLSHIEDVFSHL